MMTPGSLAIWMGLGGSLLGAFGIIFAGVSLNLASPGDSIPAIISSVLLLGSLIAIGVGLRWEWRRRDRIEDGLRKSEALLRAAVAALEKQVAVLDATGRVLTSTRVIDPTANGTAAAQPGAGVRTTYVPDLVELRDNPTPQARAAWDGIHAVIEGSQSEFQLEYPVRDEAGTRWFLMRVNRLTETSGPVRVAVVNEEITERVLATQALQKSEKQFRSLVTSVDDLIFALDREQRFLSAFGHWLEREGFVAGDFIGRAPSEIFGVEPGRHLAEVGRRVLEGEHLLHDWTLSGRTGERHLRTSFSPLREGDGAVIGIVGVGRDITTQMLAEAESRRRDAIMETIGFASSHFLRSTEWETSIRDVLEHLARATDVVRVNLYEHLTDSEGLPVLRLRQKWSVPDIAGLPFSSANGDIRLSNPDLKTLVKKLSEGDPVFVKSRKLPDSERAALLTAEIEAMAFLPVFVGTQWAGVLGFDDSIDRIWSESEIEALRVAADVFAAALDRMRIEDALQESEAQLQQAQKMEAVGRLAGGVAHDFNNLLTAIKGRTELLLSDGREAAHFESDLTEIRAAAIRAATLTRQLLAFSRRQILEPKVLDLNQIVRDIQTMLRRLIGEDIILVTRLAPDLGSVQADPGHVEQVLMNLMINARDAMPEGGAITIETANLHLDRRAARLEGVAEPGSYILFQVSDTGSGIPPELHERIFEPFFTTKEQGKGTGLGLSMIWGIVKQSGGHIRVQSVMGEGTRFRILLPRGATIAAAVAPVVLPTVPMAGTETILLVEDEAAVRSLVRKVLERRGYRVLEATNGAEAIQIVESYTDRIDLILTDVVMPDIGGPALVEILAPRIADLRVLFMSGYTDQEIIRRGVDEFHAGFIGKPFSPDELAAKVREILDADITSAMATV